MVVTGGAKPATVASLPAAARPPQQNRRYQNLQPAKMAHAAVQNKPSAGNIYSQQYTMR